ncbi:MAG: PAS domain S-box protein, partial [archaeon]
ANQAFEDVTGYAPTDVIGRNPRLLKSGEMPDGYYAELWETVTSGETWEEEIINERGDGELYHAHQTIAPVTDETGTIEAYVAIQTDITDQKERIAAIERLSEYRYIQSEVNQLLITHNAEDDILSQIVEILADSGLYACTFLSTLDSESIEFICEAGSELDHAAVQLFHTAAYVDAVIDDGTLYIEDVTAPPFEQHLDDVPAHEGYAVELSYRDNSYGILTVHFPPGEEIRNEDRQLLEELAGDIGLFLHARQAEAEREMFGEIVQRLDDPVMFQDRSGAFQVINDAVAEYADQPRDALLEEDEFAFMDEEAARIVAEQKQRVLDTEQPRTYEVRETFPEKGERVFKTTRYPHYDTDGSVDGTVAICRDVTSLKEREKHLRVFDRVLRHNIYNNMNVVIGNAEWIHDTPQQNHEQAAQRILDTGNDLVALANNERRIVELLTDPHHAQPIVLSPILERVHDSITNEYPDSEVRIEGTLEVTVQAIPEIEKAIYELVENGIKHHSQGTPHVTVTVQEAADAILVRIKDNGPGIPEMERSVLLAEHDITPLLHGTGLGLWLVKHIVTQSGGQLAFRENDPVGSIIELRFQADE